jgi:hypothetical protein
MVQGIFIILERYRLQGMERLESHFLLMTLMRDKNLLHITN